MRSLGGELPSFHGRFVGCEHATKCLEVTYDSLAMTLCREERSNPDLTHQYILQYNILFPISEVVIIFNVHFMQLLYSFSYDVLYIEIDW